MSSSSLIARTHWPPVAHALIAEAYATRLGRTPALGLGPGLGFGLGSGRFRQLLGPWAPPLST